MRTQRHPLLSSTIGTQRDIVSLHFGPDGREHPGGRKAYIQAALHADEPPGLLVATKLRERLGILEAEGKLKAEIVLVPVANPIGLAQWIDHSHIGRFELRQGDNFNRHYPDLAAAVAAKVEGKLASDEGKNAALIRRALVESAAEVHAVNELESLRKTLLTLAADAEIALDLHCDSEALMHLYTATPVWERVEPLARYLGAAASLLETTSGDYPFDEACSRTWWQLREQFPDRPIPLGCISVTVELRGATDVDHALADMDAGAIIAYLTHQGLIDLPVPRLPGLIAPATPLAGSEPIVAPHSGVVAFRATLGQVMHAGDPVADVIDPLTGTTTTLKATTGGILYARENRRFAYAGMRLAKIAGATAFRSGKLLSE
ncbi:MAG: succinylglutamate desuccinylase/aspartoacylase family protein [Betaproteobacteria bacterium]|nr:succinylglutamate desuccinylase/aspartoacylase family protein [Betaproteobacteria bacterium]